MRTKLAPVVYGWDDEGKASPAVYGWGDCDCIDPRLSTLRPLTPGPINYPHVDVLKTHLRFHASTR